MNRKIVYKNNELIIRYPKIEDAKIMMDYINDLSDERTFIEYQGEKETMGSETKYLKSKLENINNKKCVQLLTFVNDDLTSISQIELGQRTNRHIGVLGISVSKNFRGKGLGKLSMEYLIKESKDNLPNLEIITLTVFSKNSIAKNWYKNLGFIENGVLPNGIKLKIDYDNHISMYKSVI